MNETYNVLLTFADNKTPGNDGLPAEFYKQFWSLPGKQLTQCLNYSFEYTVNKFPITSCYYFDTKKDRDKRFVKNWRPISLTNVDAKIGSKSIARRICKVLPTIIHSDQCAYVEDRLISDALRTIDDVMWCTKMNKIPGWLVGIDFQKVFDSVNVELLIMALEGFNFGQTFIKWIRTFYNGAKSSVINNGFTSHYFDLQRGARQGDHRTCSFLLWKYCRFRYEKMWK